MLPYELEVQQRQQVTRVITTDGRHDEANLGIGKHLMQVADPVLSRVGDETPGAQSVWRQLDAKPQSFGLADSSLDAMGELRSATPRGTDDPYAISPR